MAYSDPRRDANRGYPPSSGQPMPPSRARVNFAATPNPRPDAQPNLIFPYPDPFSGSRSQLDVTGSSIGPGPLGENRHHQADKAEYLNGDYDERKPLTADLSRPGFGTPGFGKPGFYPPGSLSGDIPRPMSSISTSSGSTEANFIRRQVAPRRGATKRRIKLTREGNWINEYPVPRPVFAAIEPKWRDKCSTNEFSHMRYTAATCDPDDFTKSNGWTLRAADYGRQTEILIAVTSFNEDKILYARSLHNLMLNIRDICNTKVSKFWRTQAEEGRPPWQRITVALIADGIGPMDKSVLDLLSTVGVYQDGVIKKDIDGKPVQAHIFEYTTQISVDATPQLVLPHPGDPNNLVPVQVIFCLKQQNQKKINSHRWLFHAIGRQLDPEICVLLDAGTKPGHKAIYHLWEAFYNNRNLGGACGEIHAMINKGVKLLNPLVAAQHFEYKMSNILDKPLESTFGYVSVLPGAFSAYRYRAIQGRPLEQYFHGDHSMAERLGKKGINGMGIFTKNMFLAEDRILCFELVAKKKEKWTLTYVKPSKAETDVPESAAELISQRRRWLNGSFAAGIYSLVHFFRLYQSGHGPIRLFMFHIQALFNLFVLVMTWFALANFWLTFSIIINLLVDPTGINLFGTAEITHWINFALQWVYLGVLGLQVVLGLGNRPKAEKTLYMLSFFIFGIISLYTIVCSVILSIKAFVDVFSTPDPISVRLFSLFNSTNGVLVAAVLSTFGIYFFGSLLYRDPWHMFTAFPQYMLIAPSFINIINVYAFSNLHDVSWGTKGSDKIEALPSLTSSKDKTDGAGVVEDIQRDQNELDDAFTASVKRAVAPYKDHSPPEKPSIDDSNKTFRTRLLVVWLVSNAGLAISIASVNGLNNTNTKVKQCFPNNILDGSAATVNATCVATALSTNSDQLHYKQGVYFKGLLWATAGMAAIRFAGCVTFWARRQLGRCFRKN